MTETTPIPETVVDGKRLGRHIRHDPESFRYQATAAATIVTVEHATVGLPLDQGDIGSCTANALCGALNTAPDQGAKVYTEDDARTLYHEETELEGKPWPPNDPGGSGIEVCTAAKNAGLLSGYTHTFDLQTALGAFVVGPGIIGINWYTSFDTPDASGLVAIASGATVRGGHEVVVIGVNAESQQITCMNSWGTSYGVGGKFSMAWSTLERLLGEQGDVTIPIPASKPAPTPTPPTPGPSPDSAKLTITISDADLAARIQAAAKKKGESTDAWATSHLTRYFREGVTGAIDRLLDGD